MIAAVGNNALGTIGVNERAQILACKVSSDGSTISSAAEIEALQYIAQMKGRGTPHSDDDFPALPTPNSEDSTKSSA